MVSTKDKLKERIKELTCLYEVTSIIVNSDYEHLTTSLKAITHALKKAWQFEEDTEVLLSTGQYQIKTDGFAPDMVFTESAIKVFNKPEGFIKIGYPKEKYGQADFLEEEGKLLENVSLAVGNLLERKQIRDNEIVARRQVERTDRLSILGEITAGIAHELNTPLANILGFTELLKERLTDQKAIRDLEKIIDNAIFSREVVKNLMFFTCEMPQHMETIEVNPIVKSVLSLLKPNFQKKNIYYSVNFNNDSIKLKVDTIQLTQVLFNLIMNAIYASTEKGNIAIDVRELDTGVQIGISDQGRGIDKEIGDKIFEPFFTTKPVGEGSGLGLSVVHGIMSSHKGSISHAPNIPKGTIFTVYFPKLQA